MAKSKNTILASLLTAAGDIAVSGSGSLTGDLTVQGRLTAQEYHSEIVSSSILYTSGSTKFGDSADDTHQFTGSVNISGSILVNGVAAVGPQGTQGVAGSQGATGVQGTTGVQGLTGAQGSIGAQGNQGPTGLQGTTGAQGNQGPQGIQGTTGSQGNQGPTGQQGNQGPIGPQGATGIQGTTGAQGNQGPTGAQGNQGPSGPGVSGTQGYLSKFTSSSTIGNSLFSDNGTNGAIGGINYSGGTGVRTFNITAAQYAGIGFWTGTSQYTADIFAYESTGNLLLNADPTNTLSSSNIFLDVDGVRIGTLNTTNVTLTRGLIGTSATFNHNDAPTIRIQRNGGTDTNTVLEFTNASRSFYIGSNGTVMGLGGTSGSVTGQPLQITSTGAATFSSTIRANGGNITVFSTIGAAAFDNGINIITAPGTYTTGHGGILQFQNEDVITAGIRGVRDPGSWASSLLFYTHTSGTGNTFGTTFTEKMRLGDTGNLSVVGNIKTDGVVNWNGTNGALSYGGGAVTMETNTAIPILLKTNGTTALTIATNQASTFSSSVTAVGVISSSTVRPSSNYAADLGTSSVRWSSLFAFESNFAGSITSQVNNILADGAGVVLQGYVDNTLRIAVRGSGYNSGARGGLLASTGDFSGAISTSSGLNSSKNIVAGEATPLHLSYSSSDGSGPAVRFGAGQGFWDIQPSNSNQRISFEWSDTINALSLLSDGRVGITDTNPPRRLSVNFGTSVNDGLIVYGSQRQNTVFQSTGEHCFIYFDSHHANTFLPVLHLQRSSTTFGTVGLQRASNSDGIGAYAESEMLVGTSTTVPFSIQTNSQRRIRVASGGGVEVFNTLNVSGDLTARNFSKFIKEFAPSGSTGSFTEITRNWADELAAIGSAIFRSGGYYKGFIRSANGAHYHGFHFDILVGSIGYGSNALQYKVQNIVAANAAWAGGCGGNPFGAVNETTFVHRNNPCGEWLELYITQLGG